MRRRDLLLALTAVMIPPFALAQRSETPMVGFLGFGNAETSAPWLSAWRTAISDNGFVEGRTVQVEYRWAESQRDRLASLAADLVERQPVVIVAAGGPASAFAAKAATSTIPIVFTSVGNPVEIGLVSSLARPGGNVTGIDATLTVELDTKRLELLHELVPSLPEVGVLVNPNRPDVSSQTEQIRAAGRALRVEPVLLSAGEPRAINAAFAILAERGLRALLVTADPLFAGHREQVVGLAACAAIPAIYQWRDFVISGGLMSYGASLAEAYRQAGIYVARILKGERPENLPVARPTKFELVINLKTAKALALTVPQSLLARADEVIE